MGHLRTLGSPMVFPPLAARDAFSEVIRPTAGMRVHRRGPRRRTPRPRGVRGVHASGARRDRTDDLLLAKQALSQLSYGPEEHLSLARPGRGFIGQVGAARDETPLNLRREASALWPSRGARRDVARMRRTRARRG